MRKMLSPISMVKMQAALTHSPQSFSDLAAVSDLDQRVVTRYVHELKEANLVHVGDWDRDARGYPTIRKYVWGPGDDAPCPTKHRDDAERMRKLRAKKKASS